MTIHKLRSTALTLSLLLNVTPKLVVAFTSSIFLSLICITISLIVLLNFYKDFKQSLLEDAQAFINANSLLMCVTHK